MSIIALIARRFISPALFSGWSPSRAIPLKNYSFHNPLWKRDINNKGFTLIETILSLAILSIAVTGVLQVFFTGLAPRSAPLSIEITTGAQLVQEGLERSEANRVSLGFNQIPLGSTTETLTGAFNGYSRTTAITNWQGNANYKQVTVTVTHNGRTVASATTLVANY